MHETADGHAVVASERDGRVNATRIEEQVVRAGAIEGGRGPVIAVAAGVIQGAGPDAPTRLCPQTIMRNFFTLASTLAEAFSNLRVALRRLLRVQKSFTILSRSTSDCRSMISMANRRNSRGFRPVNLF